MKHLFSFYFHCVCFLCKLATSSPNCGNPILQRRKWLKRGESTRSQVPCKIWIVRCIKEAEGFSGSDSGCVPGDTRVVLRLFDLHTTLLHQHLFEDLQPAGDAKPQTCAGEDGQPGARESHQASCCCCLLLVVTETKTKTQGRG